MPASVPRLVELGMPPPLAKTVAAAITANTVTAIMVRRLTEAGMIPRHIRELRNQLAGTKRVRSWTDLGMAPALATELVKQMTS